jgi:hypothetical protein
MPAVLSFSTNRPTTGDNEFTLLAKLALVYGLTPTTQDNEKSLLAKLTAAIASGVTPEEPVPEGEAVYAFLNLAGTADTVITPTLLNACMIGVEPGAWEYGDSKHSGVQETPASYNHTILKAQTEYAIGPISCDGQIIDAVARKISFDQDEAPDPTDFETVKWQPGETISGNFMAVYRFEMDRTLGADTGGTSVDICSIYYGGTFATVQQKIAAGGLEVTMRPHGGQAIVIENNVRYRVHHIANRDDQLCELLVLNDATGAFLGASEFEFAAASDMTYLAFGDYAVNGDGQGEVSGVTFQKDADAVFPSFTLPAVTDAAVEQTAVGEVDLTFNSKAVSFQIERKLGAGAFSVIESAWQQVRSLVTDLLTYTDSGLTDGGVYQYRITPRVTTITGSATTSNTVTIDDGAFSSNVEFIISQVIGTNVSPVDERGMKITIGADDIEITELALWGNSGQYAATIILHVRDQDGVSLGSIAVNTPAGTGTVDAYNWGVLASPVTLSSGSVAFIMTEGLAFNSIKTGTTLTTTSAATVNGQASAQPPTLESSSSDCYGPLNFKYNLV